MAKLLIWDLDDTLWSGTLAEGDDVVLNESRAKWICILNSRGVVSSICSKNDYDAAKTKLESFGMWEEFVFPEIQFSPKGKLVAGILSDMQLRAPDVVFIDDNDLNLNEVEFENPGIRTIDARTGEVDVFLEELGAKLEGKNRSRVEEYRILERKRADRRMTDGPNEAFLASCGIRVALTRRTDNLPYSSRIEELINRTNQLNFTKSRVVDGSLADYLLDTRSNETFGVFVWDNYGYYGLVGFVSIERKNNLRHFLFSCRTMNMGVESAVASVLAKYFPGIVWPVSSEPVGWIKFVSPEAEEFKRVSAKTSGGDGSETSVRIMANCQSGAIAHYMGIPGVEFDNWPRVYRLQDSLNGGVAGSLPKVLIYGAFNDYDLRHWDLAPSDEDYVRACRNLAGQAQDSRLIVVLPPEQFNEERPLDGVTCERFARLNDIWRKLDEECSWVTVLSVDGLQNGSLVSDPRHFDRNTLLRLGAALKTIAEDALSVEIES